MRPRSASLLVLEGPRDCWNQLRMGMRPRSASLLVLEGAKGCWNRLRCDLSLFELSKQLTVFVKGLLEPAQV